MPWNSRRLFFYSKFVYKFNKLYLLSLLTKILFFIIILSSLSCHSVYPLALCIIYAGHKQLSTCKIMNNSQGKHLTHSG